MKKVKLALIALVLASGFAACNKDSDDDVISSQVEGTYVGEYGFGTDTPDPDIKFKVSSAQAGAPHEPLTRKNS